MISESCSSTLSLLTDWQIEEGKKGSESNVEHITAAKEAIAQAKMAEREIS